jgi:hypothetical protein
MHRMLLLQLLCNIPKTNSATFQKTKSADAPHAAHPATSSAASQATTAIPFTGLFIDASCKFTV